MIKKVLEGGGEKEYQRVFKENKIINGIQNMLMNSRNIKNLAEV